MLINEKRDSFLPSGSWIVLFWLPAETLSGSLRISSPEKKELGEMNGLDIYICRKVGYFHLPKSEGKMEK
jgi:hypothetical protein